MCCSLLLRDWIKTMFAAGADSGSLLLQASVADAFARLALAEACKSKDAAACLASGLLTSNQQARVCCPCPAAVHQTCRRVLELPVLQDPALHKTLPDQKALPDFFTVYVAALLLSPSLQPAYTSNDQNGPASCVSSPTRQ